MTIKDIAKESGYAVGTVSRVLNNHPDVSEKARETILAVVEKHHFRLNNNAKHLKQQASKGIAIIVKGSQNMLFASIVERLQGLIEEKDFVSFIYYIGEEENEVEQAESVCLERHPKGIFFLGSNLEFFRERFARLDVPCVLVTNSAAKLSFSNLSSVSTDDAAAAEAAVEYLIRLGHERIGVLGGRMERSHAAFTRCIGCPLGFTDFDAEGMLIEGFDQLSTMATIYNYPYYPQHMEKLGFEKDADWVEYKIYVPDAIPDKHKRISDLIQRKFNLKIKKYTSGKKIAAEYGQAIFELMNEAYAPLYGFSALSQGQIDQYIKMYLPIVDLRMVTLITDADDKLIAVGISMPSLSEALQKAKGRLLPMGWYHLMKVLFMHKYPPMLDLLLVAVKPEYQNKGVNALLFSDLIPVYQQLGFKYAESNPELELNGKVQAQWEYFETEQHKRRRAYKKSIV